VTAAFAGFIVIAAVTAGYFATYYPELEEARRRTFEKC
jgi:hypothetical protein